MNKKIFKKTISILVSFVFLVNTIGIGWFVSEAEAEEAQAAEVEAAEVEAQETQPQAQGSDGQGGMTLDGDDGNIEPQSAPASPNDIGVQQPQNILGGFQVDQFSGSGMMNVPIEVPEGPGGLKPSINLIYNSSNKDGWLGMGWGLNLGYIQRSTKNGKPNYNSSDSFVYVAPTGTIELVEVDDTINGEGEFRAKTEQAFMRFNSNDVYSGNWVMWDRDGTKYEFTGYQLVCSDKYDCVFRWYLTKIKDVYNSEINITYSFYSIQGVDYTFYPYPSDITYGQAKITFGVESRNDEEETIDNSSGFNRASSGRLSSISVSYNSQLVRKYNLTYAYSPDSTRSLLNQITQYGPDGTTALPPIKFSYQNNGGSYSFNRITTGVSLSSDYRLYPGDYNGDGKIDFIAFRTTDIQGEEDMELYISNGTSFTKKWSYHNAISGWDFYPGDWFAPGDYNADGKTDLFFYSYFGDRIGIILFEPSDPYRPYATSITSSIGNWSVSGAYYDFYPSDYDGDGKTDLFLSRYTILETCDIWGHRVRHIDTGLLKFTGSEFDFAWSEAFKYYCDAGGVWSFKFYPGDYNGDRKTDIVSYGYTGGANGEEMALRLSSGDSFSVIWSKTGYMDNWDFYAGDWFASGDYNGDGRTDLFAISDAQDKGGLLISKGSSFDAVWSNNYFDPGTSDPWSIVGSGQSYIPSDFRAIGKPDIFAIDYNSGTDAALVKYTKNYDDAFDKLSHYYDLGDSSTKFTSGDFNGDGKTDIFHFNYYHICSYDNEGKPIYCITHDLLISDGTIPDLLSKIENGLGGSISVSYTPSTNYTNDFLPLVKQVVSSVVLNDGKDNPSVSTAYSYEGGFYDAAEREFRGFRKCTVTDKEGNYIETEFTQGRYIQDKNVKGKPKSVSVKDTSGNTYRYIQNTWLTLEPWGFGTSFAYIYESVVDFYNGGGSPYLSTKNTYDYDGLGNPISVYEYVDNDGGTNFSLYRYTITPENEYINDTENWILGRPKHTYVKDASSVTKQESWMSYTDYGDISTVTAWLDTAADPTVTYKYDSYGNQTEVIDANSNKTTYTYDSSTNYTFPSKITNALGHNITYSYDLGTGNVSSITDVNGSVTSYGYDIFGRLISVVKPSDSTNYPTTSYSYENFGSVGSQRIATKQRVYAGEDKIFTAYQYFDGLGRAFKAVRPFKKDGDTVYSIISETKYDWKGRQSQASLPYFDVGGSAKWETTTYDLLDRPKTITHPDTTSKSFSYSGTQTKVTDENGNSRTLETDTWGNLIKVYEYLEGNTYTTVYEYDILGNLKKITDVKSNLWTFNYDSLGRIINSTDPDRGYWQFPEYDNNGNLKKKIDAKGIVHQYYYDALNRPTYLYVDSKLEEQYTYDSASSGKGLLAQVDFNLTTDFSGSVSFSYDSRGRIAKKTQTSDGITREAEFTYTSHDAPLTIKYPDGETITYNYGWHNSNFNSYENNFGLVTSIPNYVSSINYNAALQKSSITYYNGITTSYGYDSNRLWLTSIQTTNNLQSLSYSYDNAGNLKSITDNINSGNSQSFGYDSLNRLSSASGPYGALINYAYDEIGNIVNKEGTTLYYQGSRPHAVTSTSSGYSFDYDPNGNLTYDTGTSFSYDGLNRLIFTMNDEDTSLFLYDYTGSRIRKAVVDISCACVCDNEIRDLDPGDLQENSYKYIIYFGKIYEYDKIKNSSKKYILLNNQRIAQKDSSGTYFYHADHLGSSQVISKSDGSEAQRLLYKPYGETFSESGSQVTSYKFSGEELDKEQGLYYFGARYYNSTIGRFTQPDPKQGSLENPQTLNPYSYCANNPLTYVDPKGEFWWIFTALWNFASAAWAVPAIQTSIINNMVFYTVSAFHSGNWSLSGFLNAGLWGGISGGISMGMDWATGKLTDIFGGKGNWLAELGGKTTVNLGAGLLSGGSAGDIAFNTGLSFLAGKGRDWLGDQFKNTSVGKMVGTAGDKINDSPVLGKGTLGEALRAVAVSEVLIQVKGDQLASAISNKFNNFTNWSAQESRGRGGGSFDVVHFWAGTTVGSAFKTMGYDSAASLSLTQSYLFFAYEAYRESSYPWEYGDYYSDIAGALSGY